METKLGTDSLLWKHFYYKKYFEGINVILKTTSNVKNLSIYNNLETYTEIRGIEAKDPIKSIR